jgi:hypothetical protein
MAVRSLKALVASFAVVIALAVAAVPASAKPGNGRGGKQTSNVVYWCDSSGCYYFISLT